MKGGTNGYETGLYGIKGVPAMQNNPGGRSGAAGWSQTAGHIWLFGGWTTVQGDVRFRNDLWKYNPLSNEWAWVKGDSATVIYANNGIQGVASLTNNPGPRHDAVTWSDNSGNLWMFGGSGYPSGVSNQLWKFIFASNEWVWMKGDTVPSYGRYGAKNVSHINNNPSSRVNACSWADQSGNLWLFGGNGMTRANPDFSRMNDVWKYNPSINEWTWVRGDSLPDNPAIYGQLSIPAITNDPGGREACVSWKDQPGNFWVFGGNRKKNTAIVPCNDLWKYDIQTNEWTWMKGDSIFSTGNYGTRGIPSLSNKPGVRFESSSWTDVSGNFWLYGGEGSSSIGSGTFNDFWRYNPSTNEWTWMKGSQIPYISNVYGTQGVPGINNTPSSRILTTSFLDANDNLWLFGGSSINHNDLWRINATSLNAVVTSVPTSEFSRKLSVFPNPVLTDLHVNYAGPPVKMQLLLTDAVGNKFLPPTVFTSNCLVKMNHLPSGSYVIQVVNTKTQESIKKVIIKQ